MTTITLIYTTFHFMWRFRKSEGLWDKIVIVSVAIEFGKFKMTTPNFTVGTMHWAGSVLLVSAKPRFVCWTAKWGSVIPLLQNPAVASFTPRQPTLGIAYGDLRLV